MSKPENKQMMNPQVTDVKIGVRRLRKLTVYPLSMADQLKMTDTLAMAIAAYLNSKDDSNVTMIAFVLNLIKENLGTILEMITDAEDGNKLLEEITNTQASEIAELVYLVNYEGVLKNFKSLFGKMEPLFLSKRPSATFASDTDITQETFIEKDSEREESPSDK